MLLVVMVIAVVIAFVQEKISGGRKIGECVFK